MWKCILAKCFYLLVQNIVLYQAGTDDISTNQILGCFRDNTLCEDHCSSLPDYATDMAQTDELLQCGSTCRSKNCSFFGVEGATAKCHCGKNIPMLYGQMSLLVCTRVCSNDAKYSTLDAYRCGGVGFISVYRTCEAGQYGPDCTENCGCPGQGPCTINGICFGKKICDKGWSGPTCSVRDCSAVNGDCLTQCLSTPDAATPGCLCLKGFKINEVGVSCEDVDECISAEQNCTTCLNTDGSSTCTCLPGFAVGWLNDTISDTPICIDLDECASGSICNTFNCSNTYGSYRCICPEGYTSQGNVTSCADIDECNLSTVFCQHCKNTPGNYTCGCDDGYTLKNLRCEDVDECATGKHNCSQQQCTNTNGSFTCLTTTAVTTTTTTVPVTTMSIGSKPTTSPITTQPITTTGSKTSTGCSVTSVFLTGGSPTSETSYAYRVPVSVQFKAIVQSNCQITQPLQYMWKIIPVSAKSGASQPVLQETLQVDYFECQTSKVAFGKYIAEVTVMQPSATTNRFDQVVNKTYFQVVRTELHAVLQGGSAVTMDIKESVKLDASLSVDPEAATSGTSDLRFKWYCVKGKKILPMVAGRLAESKCHGDWLAPVANQQNTNGLPTPYTTLAECQQFCVHDPDCLGIYVDPSSVAHAYCFVKIENSPSTALNSATFYELRKGRVCDNAIKLSADNPTPCVGNWSKPKYGMHFAGGILTHDQNAVECQRHCILEILCVGIDMRYIPGSPFCWLMIQPGTATPLVGSIHLDLHDRESCNDLTRYSVSDCIANEHVLLKKTSKVIEFPASDFLNSHVQPDYTFTVVIGKPFFLSQSVSQTITLIDAKQTNDINIDCLVNCDFLMNPSFALVLRANCLRCLDQSYQWSMSAGSRGPVRILAPQDTNGGLNSAVLSVNPYVFKSAAHDLYTINLVVTYGNQVARGSNYTFETTGSPVVERCLIAPNVGYAMVTDFAISCIGAVGSVPLTFTFTLHGCTGGGETSILYSGLQTGVQKVKLPSGDAGHSYMICISATISDSFAVKTTVELKATVSGDNFTLADLQEMTRNASRLKAQGDVAGSTALLDLIAFTTNDLTTKNVLKDSVDDKKQFRLTLVNAISSLSGVVGGNATPDSTILHQSVTALRKATSNTDEIDPSGIADAIDLRKLSTNIGDGGKSLQHEVRSTYYEDSYRQLLEVGSNLISSSRSAAQETKKVKNVVDTILDVLDSASKKLSESTYLERKTSIKTDSFTASVSSVEPHPNKHTTVSNDKFSVSLPPELFAGVPAHEANEFKISVVTFHENPFWWADSDDKITSGCARVVVSRNRVEHTAPKSMSSTVSISLPMKSSSSRVKDTTGTLLPEHVAFFDIDILPPEGSGAVLKMTIDSVSTQLDGAAKFRFCSGKREDVRAKLALNSYCDCQTVWTATLSRDTKLPQSMIAKLEVDMISELGNFLIVEYANSHNVPLDVALKTSQIHCRFWDNETSKWDQSGCLPDVGASSMDLLVCKCNHLSSFAGSFFVKPNSIDIVKSLHGFLAPWENPVGLILICIVWVLFVFAMLWARRKDKFDAVMALPIDLEDNGINARYVYLLTVFTGSRYGSGTSSDVYVCLIGEVGTSASHRLWCSEYKVLQKGHVNIFILRTVASLGKLRAIRFWHYNSGKHPQWFLSRAIVYDQQSLVASHFICQSWLALNMENGVVDRTFLVATPEEVEGFQHLFLINALRGLNDKHIWISVVGRPSLSTFSRMQRVGCCLLLILGYLATNIMFFQVHITEEQKHMKLLIFTFDWGMFAIAMESAVVMFPVTLLTVSIFRNMRPPPQEYRLLRQWEKTVDANFGKATAPAKASSSTTLESSSISSKPSTTGRYELDVKQTSGMYTPKSTDSSKPETTSTISNLLKETETSDESSGSSVNKDMSHNLNRNQNFESPVSSDPETEPVYSESSSKYQRDVKQAGGMYTPRSTDSSKPETTSTISNLLKETKTSDESSGSSVNKDMSHNLNRNQNFETPVSSDLETEPVYSERSSKLEKFYSDGDEMYSPESSSSSDELTSGEGHSAASRSGENLTDDAEFQSVIEGDEVSNKGFPWWTVYIASTLIVCASVSFSALIILYTFDYGLQRSIDWLKVVILSFFTGILIQEPLKIIATAIVIAVIFKRSEDIKLANSDSVTEDSVRGLQSADKRHLIHFNQLRLHPHYRPPTRRSAVTARDMITRQLAMYRIVWEIARYVFFILLALVITNIRRDYNVFLLNDSYKRCLFDQNSYKQITEREAFWNWTATSWMNFTYADDETSNIVGLMGSGTSVLMRSPRLVRFPKGTSNPLRYLYSNETGIDDTISLGMKRSDAVEAIASLLQKSWVHRHIGGAIVEAVSYTASVDLLSVFLVILELPSSGGINIYNYVHTLKFHQYQQTLQLVSFGLEILYFVFTLWFLVYVTKQVFHVGVRKYFGSFWNWLDFLVVLLSVSLIVVYGLLNVLLVVTVKKYAETRELEFTYVAMLDILLSALLGFVCVLGIMKCLQLLRFSPRINGLITVLAKASSYIAAFLFYSFCLFVVIVLLLHLLFCTIVGDFRSVGSSLMTLVLAVAKQYNYSQVYKYDSLWGPMLVLTCVLVFHIVILNMTFAIIAAAFRELKTLSQVTKDAEFLDLLFNRVFGWLDFAGRKERDKANQLKAKLEPSVDTVSRSGF